MHNERPKRTMRVLIAVSFAAWGAQQIIFGDFVSHVVGVVPAWIPAHTALADLTGLALIAAAVGILLEKRNVAVALGIACLALALLTQLPPALANPANIGRWVSLGKALTIAGCAFVVAASLGAWLGNISPRMMILYGKWSLGAFMIYSGILHFQLRGFVAGLFPPWIPFHMPLTLIAGVLLICGGLGMMLPATTNLASLLSGVMILAWVPLIHVPLTLKNFKNPGESVPVFEALAFGSLAVLAWTCSHRSQPKPVNSPV
jgi:uncharacterized membrane protein